MKRKKNLLFIVFVTVVFCLLLFVFGKMMAGKEKQQADTLPKPKPEQTEEIKNNDDDKNESSDVEVVLNEMTLDEKIYQMMFVTPESITGMGQVVAAGETTKAALGEYPVGGIIYFTPNLENREQVTQMIKNSQEFSKRGLFIGVDEEGGKVARLSANPEMGIEKVEPMKEVGEAGNKDRAYEIGKTLGEELSTLGFNVDFAPVADIITNKNNTEIGDRAFGDSGEKAAPFVEAVVSGLEEKNVSATLKHFPGHGSTENNSHTGYSESMRTLEQLRAEEFIPFKKGIDAGADFIMISHATYVNVTEEDCPASLSKEIIGDLLIDEIGFNGIVITDSFSMGAITENYSAKEAAVKAINAGVNMILMPVSVKETFTGIKEAVEDGEIGIEKIDESVRKILSLKSEKGIL